MINGLFAGELQPDTTIAGCIDIFENVWPDPTNTIDLVEQMCSQTDSGFSWSKSSVFGDGQKQNVRTNYDMGITHIAEIYGNQLAKDIHNQMYFLLVAALGPYSKKYGINTQLFHENYSILKYSCSQMYHPHYDGDPSSGRMVSAIVYLNNEYEGGEIEFINFGIKIKPEPGMLIIFPSNYAYSHIAHPVTSGTKYAIVTWITDRWIP